MDIHALDSALECFIQRLEPMTIAKILRTIDLLERFGHALQMPHAKKISRGVFELRIKGRQEVRIFYTFHRNAAVLLHGYIKKSDRIPAKELAVVAAKMKSLGKI